MDIMEAKGKSKIIDYAGLFFVGFLSLGYLLYYRNFAKLHINLSIIGAPFFIGDIIFTICFSLFVLKWLLSRKRISMFSILLLLYCIFVGVKTFLGYSFWGSLALRHSVLFFYPLFAVFCYSFYRKDFFGTRRRLFLIFLFILIFKFSVFHPYFSLTCLVITLVLINSCPQGKFKYILYILLLAVFPYELLFNTSRTFITSNLLAIMYIGFGLLYISKINNLKKIVFYLFFIFFIFYAVTRSSNPNELGSLVKYKVLIKKYNNSMELLRIKEPVFIEPRFNIKLYNEESDEFKKIDQNKIRQWIKALTSYFKEKNTAPIAKIPSKSPSPLIIIPDKGNVPTVLPETSPKKIDKADIRVGSAKSSVKFQDKLTVIRPEKPVTPVRSIDTPYENSLFRIFIWEEALKELRSKLPVWGFDFGKPFRSRTLEILGWGQGEWSRDGWVCLHNSYIDILYRGGIPGILMITCLLVFAFFLVKISFQRHSVNGVLLIGIVINWFFAANFLEILEMPYSAIPLWSLFGLTSAYLLKNKNQ
ncbi:MAG: hypothetical protein PHC29_06880 [Candidatus Omnitrophica bacterium]|nr:hypothetical protein [Candidatus Omnitrophota bacterium]